MFNLCRTVGIFNKFMPLSLLRRILAVAAAAEESRVASFNMLIKLLLGIGMTNGLVWEDAYGENPGAAINLGVQLAKGSTRG